MLNTFKKENMFFLIFKGSLTIKSHVQSMVNMYWPYTQMGILY